MDHTSKLSLTNGVILGLLMILFSTLSYVFELSSSLWFMIINGFVVLALIIVGLVWGTRSVRDKTLDGNITFGKALIISFVIGFVAILLNTIFSYILNAYIDPDYSARMMENMIAQMEAMPGIPEANIEELYKQYELTKSMTPFQLIKRGMWQSLIFLSVISLIVSLVIKKHKTPFENIK